MDYEKHSKEKRKKHKKKHKKHKKKHHSSSPEVDWVEKPSVETAKQTASDLSSKRDSWMTDLTFNIPTTSNHKLKTQAKFDTIKDKSLDTYNPSKNSRELNPYWKDGGDGLPSLNQTKSFLKPKSEDTKLDNIKQPCSSRVQSSGDWRKKSMNNVEKQSNYDLPEPQITKSKLHLTDKEINELAARVLKAEILGNHKLHDELKLQLEQAREYRKNNGPIINTDKNDVLLSVTDKKGQTKPVQKHELDEQPVSVSKKKQKIASHVNGERVRYFGDDDQYNLNEMFVKEKLSSDYDDDASFMKIASKLKHPDDDVIDLFENTLFNPNDRDENARNKAKALKEHKTLLNCSRCINSDKFNNQLTINVGDTMYLSIPPFQSITEWHCFLIPLRHVSCSTQLDEDEWNELQEFRRKLSDIFVKQKHVTVFFECARDLHNHPHMMIECVPLPEREGSLAPMYFKKAILECEKEWSNNKKLIELKKSNIRRVVPKGLAYFCVEFDSEPGFAHVIEDRRDFPKNFAQEIIGGLLDLHHSVWRKPKYETSSEIMMKVNNFKKIWT